MSAEGRRRSSYICALSLTYIHIKRITLPIYIVPLKPPENFQATAGEREVTFSWSTPSISAPITGYNLSCSPSPSSLPRSFTLSGMYTMTGFYPNTVYNCSLVSYNSYNTMRSAVIFTTLTSDHEDCKFQSHTLP